MTRKKYEWSYQGCYQKLRDHLIILATKQKISINKNFNFCSTGFSYKLKNTQSFKQWKEWCLL